MSVVFDTEKGELCTVECWQDEDYEERYEDGDRDLIWIDRIHEPLYDNIDNFITQKFADITDTVYIELHACRSSTVTVFEKGDEEFGLFGNDISVDEIGDDCLGGGSYIWQDGQLNSRYSLA